MLIVEFFGGPGCGKTTNASGAYYHFKRLGYPVEWCREYAQDLIHKNRRDLLSYQLVVSAGQYAKYKGIESQGFKIVFSDSSLELCKVYGRETLYNRQLHHVIDLLNEEFDRIKVFVRRDPCKVYRQEGRVTPAAEAKRLDCTIEQVCGPFDIEIMDSHFGFVKLVDELEVLLKKYLPPQEP